MKKVSVIPKVFWSKNENKGYIIPKVRQSENEKRG